MGAPASIPTHPCSQKAYTACNWPGNADAASALWTEAGCGYEAALALCDAEDEAALRRALEDLQRLDARPAVAIVMRRLRERGVISLPRGPNFTTRKNQYGLTGRELEVLALVNKGFQNSQIADHLVVSVRTVDHHVEAILRKLGPRTRADSASYGDLARYRRAPPLSTGVK